MKMLAYGYPLTSVATDYGEDWVGLNRSVLICYSYDASVDRIHE